MDALTKLVLFWVFWTCFRLSAYEDLYMVRSSLPRGTVLAQCILCCGVLRMKMGVYDELDMYRI
jgi:hypothetical protein